MSDITFVRSGIRQNLLSLQDTAANLTTTQEHLATGKKSTRLRQSHQLFPVAVANNRANDLELLLDQIGQAAADA